MGAGMGVLKALLLDVDGAEPGAWHARQARH